MSVEQALAVFDLGKTNAKLLGFGDRSGKLLFDERTAQRSIEEAQQVQFDA